MLDNAHALITMCTLWSSPIALAISYFQITLHLRNLWLWIAIHTSMECNSRYTCPLFCSRACDIHIMSVACRLELKWFLQDKSICKVFTCFVRVLMMWSDWGWRLGEGANFYFSRGTKNWVFWHYQVQKAVWNKTFCESCVHLDITHSSVHMTRCDSRLFYWYQELQTSGTLPYPKVDPVTLITNFQVWKHKWNCTNPHSAHEHFMMTYAPIRNRCLQKSVAFVIYNLASLPGSPIAEQPFY